MNGNEFYLQMKSYSLLSKFIITKMTEVVPNKPLEHSRRYFIVKNTFADGLGRFLCYWQNTSLFLSKTESTGKFTEETFSQYFIGCNSILGVNIWCSNRILNRFIEQELRRSGVETIFLKSAFKNNHCIWQNKPYGL